MYYSMSKKNDTWFEILNDYKYHCSTIQDDLILKKELPSSRYVPGYNTYLMLKNIIWQYFSRYLRIHYEDLVDHKMKTLNRIYGFMRVPFTHHEAQVAWEHSHFKQASLTDYHINSGYYFTYVPPNFVHDKWKQELNSTVNQYPVR